MNKKGRRKAMTWREVKLKEETKLCDPAEHSHCSGWDPVHIKEEPELHIKQEPEEFPFHVVTANNQDDVLHQSTEENKEETNGEAGCSSVSDEEHTDNSSDTDDSEEYSPHQSSSKRSYAMIPLDSFVTDHRPLTIYSKSCVTDPKMYGCSQCEWKFDSNEALLIHMRVHSAKRPHKCLLCNKRFTYKYTLDFHMKSHMEKRPYVCSVCEKGFKHKFHLTQHLQCLCPLCKTCFQDKAVLHAHLRTHESGTLHPDPSVIDVLVTDELCSRLDYNKEFLNKSHLQTQPLNHTGEEKSCVTPQERCTGESTYINPVCGRDNGARKKGVRNKLDLMKQGRTHEEGDSVGPDSSVADHKLYCCSQCDRRFDSVSLLPNHMQFHSGERPHECPICNKAFKKKHHLKEHMKYIHVKQKPFECSLCEKRYSRKSDLNKHMKIHLNVKPFVCSVCTKCFKCQYTLNLHMKSHPDLVFVKTDINASDHSQHLKNVYHICPFCKICFPNKNTLNEHLKTHVAAVPIDEIFVLPFHT